MQGVGPEDGAEFAGGVGSAAVVLCRLLGGRVREFLGGGVDGEGHPGLIRGVVGSAGGEDDAAGGGEVGAEEEEEVGVAEVVGCEGLLVAVG